MTYIQIAEDFLAALRHGDRNQAKSLLDDGAIFRFPRTRVTGAKEVADYLAGSAQPIFREGDWGQPYEEKGEVFVPGRQGLEALKQLTASRMYDAMLILGFVGDKISEVKLEPRPESRKPGAVVLKLSQPYKDAINNALADGAPLLLGFVTPNNRPRITPRGSIQVYSDTQLSVWIRDRETSSFLKGIATNPHVALYLMNMPKYYFLEMTGVARVDQDPTVRERVYDIAPEPERDHDFTRHGVAVIIDLETLEGSDLDVPGSRIIMKRA